MPVFAQRLLAWSRRYPMLALLVIGGSIWFLWKIFAPFTPTLTPRPVKAQSMPGVGGERAVMEKTLLDVQKDNATLREAMQSQERTLHQMQQALQGADRDRQAANAAQEQKLEDILKRAQQQQKVSPPSSPRDTAKTKKPLAEKLLPVQSEPVVRPEAGGKVRILRSDKAASFTGSPPAFDKGNTAYLPAGSFAEAKVVTGAIATSRAQGALPILFSVSQQFRPPSQLQGPGRNPLETAMPIQGCRILGKAAADLGSSRVLIQLDLLTCVMVDGATLEQAIRGYAVGADGTLGIVGRVETHDSAVIGKAFLTSLLAGASESFRLAKQTTLVTPLGGTVNAQQGNYGETAGFAAMANASGQLSQFYLQQASQLLPTLWLEANTPAKLVLQEGVELQGLPVTTTLSSGGLP